MQQHFCIAVLAPEDERRAMIRSLVGCAFIAGSFRQPLLVGRFSVERALGKQLAIGKRNAAILHGTIAGVPPLIHVLPGIVDVDDGEARFLFVLVLSVLFVFVVAIAIPARLGVVLLVIRLGCSGISDMADSQTPG